jgi:hypothetical protein
LHIVDASAAIWITTIVLAFYINPIMANPWIGSRAASGKIKILPQIRLPGGGLKVSLLRQKQVLSDLKRGCHWREELSQCAGKSNFFMVGKWAQRKDRISKTRGFKRLKIDYQLRKG